MSSVETIARRYASALADAVGNKENAGLVREELGQWTELITSNSDLQNVFSNPSIAHAKKELLLEALINRTKPSKTTGNFLRVLLQNNRLSELSQINRKFVSVVEDRGGLMHAFVSSAHDLSESQKDELKKNLEKITGKSVTLHFKTDPDLIGGVVTRVGSTVYDGSVRTQLENLREQLMQK